ncbi:MAG: family 10 glycosylhydrolase [Cyanobacteria bacterium P01_C01_bin.120]
MKLKLPARKLLGRAFLIGLSALFVVHIWQAPVIHSQAIAPGEIRGVWMTNYGTSLMYHTTRLDDVVANLARHNLNTLYPAVWNRGYTLYASRVARNAGGIRRDRLTSLPFMPWQDPLRTAIYQAHRQQLRLIPWFEYGLMMPISSAIAQRHPDWLTTNLAGETVAGGAAVPMANPLLRPLWQLRQEASGANQGWLNPFHPEVQTFLVELITEVVQRYPVDGIQLDDHFGLPVEFGYDSYTQALYQQEHGGVSPPEDPKDPEWKRWRAAKITELMGQITTAVKAINPDAIVSLSPNTPDFAYDRYLQDWRTWVNQGWLDEVIVQVYRDDLAVLESELQNPELLAVNQQLPMGIGLYTGPAINAKPVETIQQEMAAVKAAGYRGMAFFCWETTLWIFKDSAANQVHEAFTSQFPA